MPTERPGLLRRAAANLKRALPRPRVAAAGAIIWALVTAAGAVLDVWHHGWQTPEKFAQIGILYALGGIFGFPLGLYLARFVALGRSPEVAFAAMFLGLAGATIGMTFAFYALEYRQYYATWHANFPSITWVFQFVFTTASSLIQFIVLGLPLFFPVGFAGLFAASLWFARQPR